MTMQIFRHFDELPPEARGGAVAVGNFDGVHRGHWAVIGEAGRVAAKNRTPHVVMTFEPHPRSIFQPDFPPFRLTPFRAKAIQIERLGVDVLCAVHFDRDFAARSAESFIEDVLVGGLGASHVVIGYDFVFGRGRTGDRDLLYRMADTQGYGVSVVRAITHGDPAEGGEIYASSRIREYLMAGKPLPAADRLGRWWEIDGRVVAGDKRGRRLGFPTANVALNDYLLPALGVYAIRIAIEGDPPGLWRGGVANLGRRPTFDGKGTLLEVHVFDFDREIYDRHVRVAFLEFLRPERKFDVLDALKAQIAEDCDRARSVLSDPDFAQERFDGVHPGDSVG
jgi:riboflavin kinase/FMN adenylyltransferase